MYSSSSEVASIMGRRWKFWPFSASKWANRRLLGRQLICRLPLLTLWTLIVIVVLYKSLSETNPQDINEAQETQETFLENPKTGARKLDLSKVDQLNDVDHDGDEQHYGYSDSNDQTTFSALTNNSQHVISGLPNNNLSTTKKSITDDYIRRSKVFILIIQSEDHKPGQILKRAPYARAGGQRKGSPFDGNKQHPRFFIPAHLRLLIEILNSHRIEYTVDTTKTGLPTSLLIDQDNSSDNKQYSVIVIDDFIKYTKLNRWMRDQLDRHCRTNQIGVVAYLMATDDVGLQRIPRYGRDVVSTTEETLANSFPLSFKSIPQHNKSCNDLKSSSCLVDYQLNERSPILRILKRRPNFILEGPIGPNLDQSPWVSMSSNHITYEPLTWARFRRTWDIATHLSKSAVLNDSLDLSSTHETDYTNNQVNSSSSFSRGNVEYNQQRTNLSMVPEHRPPSRLVYESSDNDAIERQILSMFDRGLYDGIKRVIFGGANHNWLNRIILLDAIEHLSSGRILGPLDRYIQVDVDDIFVGERGTRMNASDVDYLVEVQRKFANRIEGGFKFNLGFSGKFFKRGFEQENEGDERLVSRASEFTWFCHTWSHSKAHLANDTRGIELELRKNLEFARKHKLPLIGHDDAEHIAASAGSPTANVMPPTYAVAPHHSGVYPVHEQLYDAWRRVLNVQVTSTEEYPHLRPANGRRAFVHKTIRVLPRQTCGLYTHTIYRHRYPGGPAKLEASIRGGELFESILHNPVNIYMSHMSNYANDRLAPYTFSALLDFVQTNTNLQLKYAPSGSGRAQPLGPAHLADHYFSLYPDERQPLWTDPCNDKRHLAIWAHWKHELYCPLVPRLLIVGPQKTGTTALYTFLKMNHLFRSSQVSPTDFEEVQFFNDKHYLKGVDWYLSRFQAPLDGAAGSASSSAPMHSQQQQQQHFYFDKSATYFDDPKVARRASYLLPEARIVILLVNPADRAYSWYQHMRAHGDPAASSLSFEQIIAMDEEHGSLSTVTLGGLNDAVEKRDPTTNSSAAAEEDAGASGTGKLQSAARALRNRCLHPGYYAQHLLRWLDYYSPRQIIIIDGQWFRHNPASVMNRLQLLLRIERPLDYNNLLVYDPQKGFYCQRLTSSSGGSSSHNNDGHQHQPPSSSSAAASGFIKQHGSAHKPAGTSSSTGAAKCLGESKGRRYEPMSQRARLYLNRHYWPHNRQLARILSDIGQPLPIWLDEAVASVGRQRGGGALMY